MHDKNISGMGALPLIIIIGLILGAGWLLIGGDIENPFKEKTTVEVRRLEGFPLEVPRDETDPEDKIQKLITNEDELIEFLAEIDQTNTLSVGEKINFEKEYLIGVSTKVLDKNGHEFKIRKVYVDKEKDSLLVSSELKKPDDNCDYDKAYNSWVDIVAVSKTDREIEYDTLVETIVCDGE